MTLNKIDFMANIETMESYGIFQISNTKTSSELVNFFEHLYSYPQKLTLKWETLIEYKNDLPKKCEQQFDSTLYKWTPNYDGIERADEITRGFSAYKKGFLNKVTSSNFYKSTADEIKTSLSNIPVFVILNGDNEILLSKGSNSAKPANLKYFINKVVYDSCGAFDLNMQNNPDLGFFFFNSLDAENYLNSVAKVDIDGTRTVGLSIHCLGLDSAYTIMREHHPSIDFRFIPDLSNVKNLEKTEIGVPIYIVDFLESKNQNKEKEQNCTQVVFFDRETANKFYKEKRNNKPNLSIDSFENFLEQWEEKLYSTDTGLIQKKIAPIFLSTNDNNEQFINISRPKKIINSLGQKTRILKRFIGIFFSAT